MNLPAGDFLVGYVGKFKTLGMEKGIKTMISAIPLLGKEIKIVFVGAEESEIKEYKNMANRLNALSQCLIINNQPYLKAVKYMNASDLPALREILNDKNALFFKPEDVDDLARAVKMLKLSQTLCYHLSGQAFSDVKNYTWGARAKKILNFLP
ncbi:MAG: Glycosyl transferase group 1 [Candidatus Azambacteria bacterium GW2011_GWB1_42_72]|nr:MAG: Glycosyl transferase group 1 [Candidatus Azambacteria bacterium GW2011_GWB1_42_72]